MTHEPSPPDLVLIRLKEPLPPHFKREQPAIWTVQTAGGYQDFHGTTWNAADVVELRRTSTDARRQRREIASQLRDVRVGVYYSAEYVRGELDRIANSLERT